MPLNQNQIPIGEYVPHFGHVHGSIVHVWNRTTGIHIQIRIRECNDSLSYVRGASGILLLSVFAFVINSISKFYVGIMRAVAHISGQSSARIVIFELH